MFLHEGYCVSGSAIVQAEDGSETRIGSGDGYVIQPGHDAWVVGDEPWVTVDFSQEMADYAKPRYRRPNLQEPPGCRPNAVYPEMLLPR
jgi:hypothetical protein